MPMSVSRKRRRKLSWCGPSALLSLFAIANCSGVRGELQLQRQRPAIETVQAGRYTPSGATGETLFSLNASSFTHGRYGHAAVYQQYRNRVLFIGGQIGTSGTYITNDVLSLDLNKPYTRHSTLSGFTESTNPALVPELSVNLPPSAWSAYAVDAQERIWIIGGVTQDCEDDAAAYVLQDAATWIPVDLGQYRPPRRRQAGAIAINNGTKDSSLFVFGGIAEPYTCSLETVGYLAMDIWNATSTPIAAPPVVSVEWQGPAASNTSLPLTRNSEYEPALSDYAAVSLPNEKAIIYIGGQDASGKLASMDQLLVFNTSTFVWSKESATGRVPPSSIGHSATLLEDSRIVVFGGVKDNGAPSSELRLLSRTAQGGWCWTAPDVWTGEVTSPSRAWHTATLANDGLIVYAFGLDGSTGETAYDLYFLRTSGSDTGWQWYRTNPAAIDAILSRPTSQASDIPVYTGNAHVVLNAGADDGKSDPLSSQAVLDPSIARNAMAAAQTPLLLSRPERSHAVTASDSDAETEIVSPSSSYTDKTLAPTRPPESPASSELPSSADTASTTTTKSSVIAGTVTAAFVAALLAGAAALYVRRRASQHPNGKSASDTDQVHSGIPPVSQLLYTRVAPKRMLSLGSTLSDHTVRNLHNLHADGITFERVTRREAGDAVDFDEFGRLSPSSDSATVRGPTAQAMTHASSADSAESQASVASYPFLTSVARNTDSSSQSSHEEGHIDLGSQPQFSRWPSSSPGGTDGDDGEESRGVRSSIDVTDESTSSPFDDFHAVLSDTPSHASLPRQRASSFLPPS